MQNTATLQLIHTKETSHQQILVDNHGFVIESNDNIFSTFPQRHRPITEWSSFYESILPILQSMNLKSDELYLPRIQSITNTVFGLYDCSFMCVEWGEDQHVIVWNIIDKSADLYKIQKIQQTLNEIRIRNNK